MSVICYIESTLFRKENVHSRQRKKQQECSDAWVRLRLSRYDQVIYIEKAALIDCFSAAARLSRPGIFDFDAFRAQRG